MSKSLLERGYDIVNELYELGLLDDQEKEKFEALKLKPEDDHSKIQKSDESNETIDK